MTLVTKPDSYVDAMDIAASKPSRIKRPRRGAAKGGAAAGPKINPLAPDAKNMAHRGTEVGGPGAFGLQQR